MGKFDETLTNFDNDTLDATLALSKRVTGSSVSCVSWNSTTTTKMMSNLVGQPVALQTICSRPCVGAHRNGRSESGKRNSSGKDGAE
jgi:hypothetical protein